MPFLNKTFCIENFSLHCKEYLNLKQFKGKENTKSYSSTKGLKILRSIGISVRRIILQKFLVLILVVVVNKK